MKKFLILLLILLTGCGAKVNSHNYFYMDTYINVKIYENVKPEIFKEIDNIYRTYHELADRYNNYDGIQNVYFIRYNNDSSETLKLDPELCKIIHLGENYREKSGNKFNINMALILDVWKDFRENGEGVPTLEELKLAKERTPKLTFTSECEILNNKPALDLGAIAKGYATEQVGAYLKKQNINKFLINAGGNILAGETSKEYYKIGLETPDATKSIYKVLKIKNKSVVTSGGYERFYEYDGVPYHHIVDYATLYPTNNFKSVTVIADNSAQADALSTTLFLLDLESGKELAKKEQVEAIWYLNDGKIIETSGVKAYE